MKRLLFFIFIGVLLVVLFKCEKNQETPKKSNDIGTEQNKNEEIYHYPNHINFGKLNKAPKAEAPKNKKIDVLAHWYNDFGLEYTASSENQSKGSYTWYDWSWNHTDNPNYDPSRHPLLGWYKGDDPTVLDWQSYWLVKYGIKGTILTGIIDKDNFYEPSGRMYWTNILFNKVKNFQKLKYVLWFEGNHDIPKAKANAQQDFIIDHIVAKHSNVYTYNINGKKYPVFFIWDMEGFRGTYDNYQGSRVSERRMVYLSERMKKLGYDGICIVGRNLIISQKSYSEQQINELQHKGVYLLRGTYSNLYGKNYNNSYKVYAKTAAFPSEGNNVVNVMTSAESQYPHPSKWNLHGSTPELFKTALERAVNDVQKNNIPKFLTIYNVSEWAEGGPGLQPNKRDGFGYLNAVKEVLSSK